MATRVATQASRNANAYISFLENLARVDARTGQWFKIKQMGPRAALRLANQEQNPELTGTQDKDIFESDLDALSGSMSKMKIAEEKEPDVPRQSLDTNVPLPRVLRRHLLNPSLAMQGEGKITGFRVELSGRRGLRSARSRVAYGRLGTNSYGTTHVDFGRAYYVSRRAGTMGVRVWVGYER
ncbi:hypothetical protein M427DRAFT_132078 [Gonapodya prolifera JEL478]|uniref:Ribosomal protein S3 n=1 Tax=Gonapodya prolifera (strain JEL478) TaxID=1344416 RepID=A0A139ASB4_GONPJ|nr:hypothetical protein M427DRAFT_132078 [Gonapodya prolifera JEL478]|eukprot:KXS19589.1 hypothetical protein M427DRAFT_132078 [Gonapodya prolifera JEL478]